MKKVLFTLLFFVLANFCYSQRSENVIIITLDGFRWQEVFGGADSFLINNQSFVSDTGDLKRQFWASTPEQRRRKLLPFFWSTVERQGQLYGNRWKGSQSNVLNPFNFSYPGYNEIFTGYPDTAVNSNDKVLNKNENVLEYLNKQKNFSGKVAAFTSWDVFPYILNEQRGGIYVNADVDTFSFSSPQFQLLNEMQFLSAKPLGLRTDIVTYLAAKEYLKEFQPRVLYIAFDETDDYAHNGNYDQYLLSAHAEDAMIADLWNLVQSLPAYKNNTTLIITCDHGRGEKEEWKYHGKGTQASSQTWMAFLGKSILAGGESKQSQQIYQGQLAQTIAQLLGYNFKTSHPVERALGF